MCNNAEEISNAICPDRCPGEVFFDDNIDAHGWPDMRQVTDIEIPIGELWVSDVRADADAASPVTTAAQPSTVAKKVHRVGYVRFVTDHQVVAAVALPYLGRDRKLYLRRHPRLMVVVAPDGCLFCVVKPLVLPPKER